MRKLRKFKDSVIENLQDQEYATTYLDVAREEYSKDNDIGAFFLALKDVAEAKREKLERVKGIEPSS